MAISDTIKKGAIALDDKSRKQLLRRWELLKNFDERLRNDSTLAVSNASRNFSSSRRCTSGACVKRGRPSRRR